MQRSVAEFSPAAASNVVERIQSAELLNCRNYCALGGLGTGGVSHKEPRRIA